jgi:hypothetical protein
MEDISLWRARVFEEFVRFSPTREYAQALEDATWIWSSGISPIDTKYGASTLGKQKPTPKKKSKQPAKSP